MTPEILFEDHHIIICIKPQGIPSQSDKTLSEDMISLLKNYLSSHSKDRKTPELYVVHRLDRPVGGVMVYAKSSFAAKELSRQIQEKTVKKSYLAVVCQNLSEELFKGKTVLTDYLIKDGRTNLSKLSSPTNKNSKKAQLSYAVLSVNTSGPIPLSLLEIELFTGRHHQIRVQLACHKGGIYGDTKYNPLFQPPNVPLKSWFQTALFSHALELDHPITKERLRFQKLPENEIFLQFPELIKNGQ